LFPQKNFVNYFNELFEQSTEGGKIKKEKDGGEHQSL
jgi:hypothetical protein